MKKAFMYFLLVIFMTSCRSTSVETNLTNDINKLIDGKKMDIGVSVRNNEGNELVKINNDKKYRLYSVSKYFLALYILHLVDQGKMNLNQQIVFSKEDLRPDTYSPLRDSIPQGTTMSLKQSVSFMLKRSDNNIFDKLANHVPGSFGGLNTFIHEIHMGNPGDFSIMYDYTSPLKDFESNRITPGFATKILYQVEKKKILSDESFDLLKNGMEHSVTNTRIQGLIQNKTKSFHKSGTSGRDNGVLRACNDIGIVNLQDGKSFSIAVFISDSHEDNKTNDDVIAKITDLVYSKLNK